MTRVKMNAKHEYEFIANFKVMQNVFKSKRIEKARSPPLLHFFPIPKKTNDDNNPPRLYIQPIPVEKLVKCKMQCVQFPRLFYFRLSPGASKKPFSPTFPRRRDNLEFLQWMKRFWDTNYPGHPYDPVARRRGQATDTPTSLAPIASSRAVNTPGVPGSRSGGKTPIGGHRTGSASAMNHEQVAGLQAQLKEMSTHLEGLEKERDFYFAKVTLRPSLLLSECFADTVFLVPFP